MKFIVSPPVANELVVYMPGPQGPKGAVGASWLTAAGAPTAGTGILGDFYLNSTNGDFYEKTTSTIWTLRGNLRGAQGIQGLSGTLGVGTVTTGAAGSSVAVTNSGTATAATLNFTIPRGDKGATGTLALGTVTTGAAGSNAAITNTGTPEAGIFNFTIPKGDRGSVWLSGAGVPAGGTGVIGDWYLNTTTEDVYEKTGASVWTLRTNIKGDTGTLSVGTVTTGAPGASAAITNTGTSTAAIFNFTIPRGEAGPQGPPGSTIETTFTSDDVAGVPLTAKGFAGQIANLQEWKNSSDTVTAFVSASGAVQSGQGRFGGISAIENVGLTISPFASNSGNIAAVVRGAASQTANLQEWQSNGGGVLAFISATGRITTTENVHAKSLSLSGGLGNAAVEVGRTDGTASTPFINFHSGATAVDYDYRIIASGGDGAVGSGSLSLTGATTQINATKATSVPFTIKAASAQSANIWEVRTFDGTTILAKMANDGTIYKGSIPAIYSVSDVENYSTMGVY